MEVVQCDRGLAEVDMSDISNPLAVTTLNLSENAIRCGPSPPSHSLASTLHSRCI